MSAKTPWSRLLDGFGEVLGGLTELAEQGRQLKDKAVVRGSVRTRSLDGSGLEDLKELAQRLRGLAGAQEQDAEPQPAQAMDLEVHEEDSHVCVILRQAGFAPERISVRVDGDMLEVEAEQDGERFRGECQLPCAVDEQQREMRVSRGLVELRWPHPQPRQRRARRRQGKAG